MTSSTFVINNKRYRRSVRQGRRRSGLGKAFQQRLFDDDEKTLLLIKERLGYLYNKNEFVRCAVKYYINTVYAELLKT